jgi:hypothetical protein
VASRCSGNCCCCAEGAWGVKHFTQEVQNLQVAGRHRGMRVQLTTKWGTPSPARHASEADSAATFHETWQPLGGCHCFMHAGRLSMLLHAGLLCMLHYAALIVCKHCRQQHTCKWPPAAAAVQSALLVRSSSRLLGPSHSLSHCKTETWPPATAAATADSSYVQGGRCCWSHCNTVTCKESAGDNAV